MPGDTKEGLANLPTSNSLLDPRALMKRCCQKRAACRNSSGWSLAAAKSSAAAEAASSPPDARLLARDSTKRSMSSVIIMFLCWLFVAICPQACADWSGSHRIAGWGEVRYTHLWDQGERWDTASRAGGGGGGSGPRAFIIICHPYRSCTRTRTAIPCCQPRRHRAHYVSRQIRHALPRLEQWGRTRG